MSVNLHKIKKWINMLRGKSVYHVCQDEGKIYAKDSVEGYYNNLTEKVTRFEIQGDVPATIIDSGKTVYFCIAIFQYGLGAYDLYLMNGDESMLKKVLSCADWAVKNQQENGAWVAFDFENTDAPYSSMAQGEGISLLLRAYKATNDMKYVNAAKKAKQFMLLDIDMGGTTKYEDGNICFYEYTYQPLILNGWIFSIWGLWDYCVMFQEKDDVGILQTTLNTLERYLHKYDMKYWSKYNIGKMVASPFYHDLHIAQLRVMYDLTKRNVFIEYAKKWEKYKGNFWGRKRAFVKKALQKIFEK